jgi:hypothetical protein
MPEGRQLEGAAGPSDGLGGKWSVILSRTPPMEVTFLGDAGSSFHE